MFPHVVIAMSKFRPVNREAAYLLPPSVEDWLPKTHPARFVLDVVEGLNLSAMTRSYRSGGGSALYHPSVMLGPTIYGYGIGVLSSRKLEGAHHDSVAFHYVVANRYPDHDRIAPGRERHNRSWRECRADPRPAPVMPPATGQDTHSLICNRRISDFQKSDHYAF